MVDNVDLRTGGVQAFTSLGERLARFTTQAIETPTQIAVQQNQAHMKQLLDSHNASLDRDLREGLGRIAAENPNDLIAFNERAEAFAQGTLRSIPEDIRSKFTDKTEGLLSSYRQQVQTNNIRKDRENVQVALGSQIESSTGDALRLIRLGGEDNLIESSQAYIDARSAYDSLVEGGHITEEEANRRFALSLRQGQEQAFLQELDSALDSSLEDGVGVLTKFAEDIPEGWAPDEWQGFVNRAKGVVRDWVNLNEQNSLEKNIQTERSISNLKIEARTGISGMSFEDIVNEADRHFSGENISGDERASIISTAVNRQKQQFELIQQDAAVNERLGGDESIVLTQSQVDGFYERHVNTSQMTAQQKNAFNAGFINDTKIIPGQVKAEIRNGLTANNPDLTAQSLDMMMRLNEIPGLPENQFSANDEAFAVVSMDLMQNLSPSEATDLARQLTDPRDQERVELRKQAVKDDKRRAEYGETVRDHFDQILNDTVDDINIGRLQKDYESLVESKYQAGMPWDKASDWALQQMEQNWSVDETSGRSRMMKHAPHIYYSVAGSTEYINQQLSLAVRDEFRFGQPVDEIVLFSDDRTAREASAGRPSYPFKVILENGEIFTPAKRFTPNPQAEIDRIKTVQQDKVLEERERAKRIRENMPEVIENLEFNSL